MSDGPILSGDPALDERLILIYWSMRLRLCAEGVKRWFQGRRGWEVGRRLLIEDKRPEEVRNA